MRGLAPFWIDQRDKTLRFPDVRLALSEPDGLLAIGGDLSPQRLETAYRHGVFPWFNHDQPILWWAPNPRTVLFPERLKISRSLRKTLRKRPFILTADHAFADVIEACSGPRPGQGNDGPGTWITPEMKQAYRQLHIHGLAHSVECWRDGALVGGLYGIAIGRVFFGESMFSRCSDASKVAFVGLVQQLIRWDFTLIDCQIHSDHLVSLGAETLPRERFTQLLERYCDGPQQTEPWRLAELEAVAP
jgi:leucyl/phenylalanyl-tRNA--protein transferase